MNRRAWNQNLLTALEQFGNEGREMTEFLRRRKPYIGFLKVPKHIGAFWTFLNTIHFNTRYYSLAMNPADPRVLTMFMHEVKHLQQGLLLALSVYGELEAWQLQFRVYRDVVNPKLPKPIEELLALPLTYDRTVLQRACELMQEYASKRYRADLLPLYPLDKEIRYRLFGKLPSR